MIPQKSLAISYGSENEINLCFIVSTGSIKSHGISRLRDGILLFFSMVINITTFQFILTPKIQFLNANTPRQEDSI